jgi:hypothetical protein
MFAGVCYRCKSEERTKEAQLYNKIIADNEFSMNRAAKLKRLADEQAEEDRYDIFFYISTSAVIVILKYGRLEARADDRRRRRLARLKAAEESETQMMESEDKRSWEHRYYLKECTIIERELRNMRAQERAQRSIDQFWGIPTHIVGRKNAKVCIYGVKLSIYLCMDISYLTIFLFKINSGRGECCLA